MTAPTDPLAKLREPFPENLISQLPKPTKAQTEAVKADYKVGFRCPKCQSWHHRDVIHLDYVGHAALTHRLLDTDPGWFWEPLALRDGLPAFDSSGGLWIKLTVCGVSRLGYGHAAAKPGQDPGAREKEVIGDALRNAGMRFGAALDLWHKGDLHAATEDDAPSGPSPREFAVKALNTATDLADLGAIWTKNYKGWREVMSEADFKLVEAAKDSLKITLAPQVSNPQSTDFNPEEIFPGDRS